MTEPQTHDGTDGIDLQMNRRQLIKTAGAVGGVAALGTGAVPHSQRLVPVQDAEASVFLAGVAVGVAAGGLAGAGIVQWAHEKNTDEDQRVANQLWLAADSVAKGREKFVKEISRTANASDPQQTEFAELAWSQIRAEAARIRVKGKSESKALTEAQSALEKQHARSYINMVNRWNAAINALLPEMNTNFAQDLSVFKTDPDEEFKPWNYDPGFEDGISPVTNESDDSHMGFVAQDISVNTPFPIENLDEYDEDSLGVIAPMDYRYAANNESYTGPLGPYGEHIETVEKNPGSNNYSDGGRAESLIAQSSLGTTTVVDAQLYTDALSNIDAAYTEIKNDLSEYISTLWASFEEGAVDPADIITPTELYDQFASSGQQQRYAAELISVGAAHPGAENIDYRVKVSHPDLQVDSLWGQLYPMLKDGEDIQIRSGTTIQPSEYKNAYLGFYEADTGDWNDRLLSGDEPLEIIETENLDTDTTIEGDDLDGTTAGADGEVIVWDTGPNGEAPDPLAFPADHPEWYVTVVGAATTSSHSISEVKERDTDGNVEFYLPSTALAEGEQINRITIKQPVDYSQTTRSVTDPTVVDSEALKEQIEEYKKLRDELESLGGISVGGGIFDGDFPSLPGLGVIESAVVVVLGIAGLNAVSG